jgi:hypothetical protein
LLDAVKLIRDDPVKRADCWAVNSAVALNTTLEAASQRILVDSCPDEDRATSDVPTNRILVSNWLDEVRLISENPDTRICVVKLLDEVKLIVEEPVILGDATTPV